MSTALKMTLSDSLAQYYQIGFTAHKDIGVPFDAFKKQLTTVIEKHLGLAPPMATVFAFLNALHVADLYLVVGCSDANESAWRRFVELYKEYIIEISRSVTPSTDLGRELAADVLSNLFLHDRSERSRIASYDGQQSLATWLVAVISHKAINDTRRKWAKVERLDSLYDFADHAEVNRIEKQLRASTYRTIINDCFMFAANSLTNHERLVLLLRFEERLRIAEIARHFNVHPSGITRLLQHTYKKLRGRMMTFLGNKCSLETTAIDECLSDILENPEHSIIAIIRTAADLDTRQSIPRR